MTKILLVEDQAIVRYGVTLLLNEKFPDFHIHSAKDGDEMVKRLKKTAFDLLVLDINIPGGNNFGIVDIIRLRQPGIKILVFSGYDEDIYAQRYLGAGVQGYVSKQSAEKKLCDAIDIVLRGGIYRPARPKNSRREKYELGQVSSNPVNNLSNRELEVLSLLIEGLSLMEIGTRLNLQLSTVNIYRHRIFEKMEVSTLVDLIEKGRLYMTG